MGRTGLRYGLFHDAKRAVLQCKTALMANMSQANLQRAGLQPVAPRGNTD